AARDEAARREHARRALDGPPFTLHLPGTRGGLGADHGLLGVPVRPVAAEDAGFLLFPGRGQPGLPADALLHLFTRLERDDHFGLDVHALAGARVSRLAGLAHLHLEDAEVAQLDPPDFDERVHDGVESLLDDFLGLELGQADAV